MEMIKFSFEGDIKPAPRPRLGKFGAYMPRDYQQLKAVIAEQAKLAMAGRNPILENVSVKILFRRKYKVNSRRYGDLDNLSKIIFDSCNGICFNDDSQVVSLFAEKVQSDNAGVEVQIAIAD